jgi:tetratricopeptide (TPR) repeat protein
MLAAVLVFWKPWNRSQDTQKESESKVASSSQPGQTALTGAAQPPAPQPAAQDPAPLAETKTRPHAETGSKSAPSKGRTTPADSAKLDSPEPLPSHRRLENPPEPVKPKPVPPVDSEELARLYGKGQDQIKQRDFRGAIQSFTAAIAISPDSQKAYFSRGLARELADQCERAIEDLSFAIRLNPQDAPSYLRRGVCLVRTRQDERALADFNRALEIKGDMPLALNGRGGIYLRRRNYAEAIRDFDAALRINPRLAQAYANRARAKRALGNMTGFDEDLKKFEELKGEMN